MEFKFECKGKVIGFNRSADGDVAFVKLLSDVPEIPAVKMTRDDKPGSLGFIVPINLAGKCADGVTVIFKGVMHYWTHDFKKDDGKIKPYERYRFEVVSVDVAAPAAKAA